MGRPIVLVLLGGACVAAAAPVARARASRLPGSRPCVAAMRPPRAAAGAPTEPDGELDDSERGGGGGAPVVPDGLGPPPNLVAPRASSAVGLELGLITFYKEWISPVLPRACRFVPTCSSYGYQAYEEHGAAKGFVLTAWRILRCNPLGGSGFDPPRWPPPALGAGSSSWWRETPFWIDAADGPS